MMNREVITLPDLLALLYARRKLVLSVLAGTLGVGMLVTFLLPPTYESTMKILITRERVDPQVTAADRTPDMARLEITDEDFNSEIEILQSRAVLEGVVGQLGLDRLPRKPNWLARLRTQVTGFYRAFHKQASPDPTERAVLKLSEHLEAVSIKKSRIIKVTYEDADPERAAQTLEELYRQYAEHNLRLRQNSKAARVFREQSQAFDRKLQEATEALKRFDVRNGIAANAAQREQLVKQFYEVQAERDQARTEIRETEQRISALRAQLATQPERIESEARTKYVEARDKMKEEILALEMQRTQLLQKFLPTDRSVVEVEERLARARDLLAREEQAPPLERTTILNDLHRKLMGELLTAQASLTTLRERERSLSALVDKYKSQVAEFEVKGLERADLERKRAVTEEAYLLYRKKAQEADIVGALNQERIVNFSLAEPPTVNHKPVSPKPLVNFAVLLVVGLAAGMACVVVTERKRFVRFAPVLAGEAEGESLPRREAEPVLPPQAGPVYFPNRDRRLALARPVFTPPPAEEDPDDASAGDDEDDASYQAAGERPAAEPWRVAAAVEHLYHGYHLTPKAIAQVLRERAGWELSVEEIQAILARPVGREEYSPKFKARVVVEAIQGQRSVNELAAKFGVRPVVIAQWKKEALGRLLPPAPNCRGRRRRTAKQNGNGAV